MPLQLRSVPIPDFYTRHNRVGKPRQPHGEPIAPLKDVTRFEPIPKPVPGVLCAPFSVFDPAASQMAENAGKLVFHAVGDVGGVNGTATEEAVATAMEEQLNSASDADRPAFHYILGDVIYYNGQSTLYKTEFYEPYQFYRNLIFAIPGNHDGDTFVQKGDPPDTEPSLTGFLNNFCDSSPHPVTPYRMTMTQPYPYWTLDAPFVRIIGLYSNVEGSLDAQGRNDQQQYLQDQLTKAPANKKLLITVHHPPFSLDAFHGGAAEVLHSIDGAIQTTGKLPDAVLSGHVHNYQRFLRDLNGKNVPYIIAGAGGYANDARSMHKLQKSLQGQPTPIKTTIDGLTLENYNQDNPGFLRITASANELLFEYFLVPFDGSPVMLFDSVKT